MSVKRIQPMRIQSIKASIKVSTDEIKNMYGKFSRDGRLIRWLYEQDCGSF